MKPPDVPVPSPAMLTVRVGCLLGYRVAAAAPTLLMIQPRLWPGQRLLAQDLSIGNQCPLEQLTDPFGNPVVRTVLPPGLTEIRYDAILAVPDSADSPHASRHTGGGAGLLPLGLLRYTLPSRYCESDKLVAMACDLFGHLPRGLEAAQAICDWTHRHLAYRYGSGDPTLSACEAIARGYGVCRDFAHVMIALCRALDMPARYVAGYMPLLEAGDTDIGIDFHACVEVHAAGAWHLFDPRHGRPHVGRVRTGHGMDAVDVAFATIYGQAQTAAFQVWSYPVDPGQVRVGDAVRLPFQDRITA